MAAVRRSNTQRHKNQFASRAAMPLTTATDRSMTIDGSKKCCNSTTGPKNRGLSMLPVGVCQVTASPRSISTARTPYHASSPLMPGMFSSDRQRSQSDTSTSTTALTISKR